MAQYDGFDRIAPIRRFSWWQGAIPNGARVSRSKKPPQWRRPKSESLEETTYFALKVLFLLGLIVAVWVIALSHDPTRLIHLLPML